MKSLFRKHWLCRLIGHNFYESDGTQLTLYCERCALVRWVPVPPGDTDRMPKEEKDG